VNHLPPLHRATLLRISLQGGVAFIPGLSRPRPIDLAGCADTERDRIFRVLEASAQQSSEHCGQGDQRYFHVEVIYRDGADEKSADFRIPENEAPEPLVGLWKKGAP
jgi:hypothetical protein